MEDVNMNILWKTLPHQKRQLVNPTPLNVIHIDDFNGKMSIDVSP